MSHYQQHLLLLPANRRISGLLAHDRQLQPLWIVHLDSAT